MCARFNKEVEELQAEKWAEIAKQESLEKEIRELRQQFAALMREPPVKAMIAVKRESVESFNKPLLESGDRTDPPVGSIKVQVSKHDESSDLTSSQSVRDSSTDSQPRTPRHRRQNRMKDPYPSGFSTLVHRVDKFSGHQGSDDFEIWLMDFNEATEHCGWLTSKKPNGFPGS